jgi:3-deoxy-manno-octulosonate cytidylyltransferase (CMP-KDO synthetase)
LPIGDKSLIERVWLRAMASGAASVLIATDDERIRDAAIGFGANCVMTSTEHVSGTDRIAEVVRARGFAAHDVVINLQGDEPMMPADVIAEVAAAVQAPGVDIATAIAPIETLAQFLDPNCVKALRGEDGRALYFSRAPVPWPRESAEGGSPDRFEGAWRHIGIYGYRAASLLQFAAWKPTVLESIEKLEQLRALEHGMRIQLVTLANAPPAGVDTPADLQRIRATFEGP